jgi:hypothetical protein
LDYLDRWFAFLNDQSGFEWILLKDTNLSFDDILGDYTRYISNDPEEIDQLVVDVTEVETMLKELNKKEDFTKLSLGEKWSCLLKNNNIVHLRKLVSALLSIFPSNAYCESVFSVINALWTDEKNRFVVDTINFCLSEV